MDEGNRENYSGLYLLTHHLAICERRSQWIPIIKPHRSWIWVTILNEDSSCLQQSLEAQTFVETMRLFYATPNRKFIQASLWIVMIKEWRTGENFLRVN